MEDNEISKIKQMLENYKSSLPKLTIFVLGPGKYNTEPYAKKCYKKRCQIKNELAQEHNVFFLEEIKEEAEREGINVSNITDFENYLIRKEADTVIVIFILHAPGLQTEIVAFSQYPELAEKMWVFYDSTNYKYGNKEFWHINDPLNSIECLKGKIVPFTENEIDDCSLSTKVKNMIEKQRNVLFILPYKKYKGCI